MLRLRNQLTDATASRLLRGKVLGVLANKDLTFKGAEDA